METKNKYLNKLVFLFMLIMQVIAVSGQNMDQRLARDFQKRAEILVEDFQDVLNGISSDDISKTEINTIIYNAIFEPGQKIFLDEEAHIANDIDPRKTNSELEEYAPVKTYLESFQLFYRPNQTNSVEFSDIKANDPIQDWDSLSNEVNYLVPVDYYSRFKGYHKDYSDNYRRDRRRAMIQVNTKNGKHSLFIASVIFKGDDLLSQLETELAILEIRRRKELSEMKFQIKKSEIEKQASIDSTKLALQASQLELKSEHERLQLEREIFELKNQIDELKNSLPGRIGIRIGAGAEYFIGQLNDFEKPHFDNNVAWTISSAVYYRFNVQRKKTWDRGTALGIKVNFGAIEDASLEPILIEHGVNTSQVVIENHNQYYDFNVEALIKEGLLVSTGLGKQKVNSNGQIEALSYYRSSIGFIGKIHIVDLQVDASVLYGRDFSKPSFSCSAKILLYFKLGKW